MSFDFGVEPVESSALAKVPNDAEPSPASPEDHVDNAPAERAARREGLSTVQFWPPDPRIERIMFENAAEGSAARRFSRSVFITSRQWATRPRN